ncbi:MAG TPA: NADH-quinone oxidoreductase subunit M [Streptomyces sp.]|nr:NADH-quinone oxidoreductase subunit M [Streptomyces sp.]
MQYLLAAIVVLPLLGSAAALFPAPPGLKGRDPDQAVLRHGVVVTGVVLALAVALAAGFDYDDPARMQATTDISWIPALGTRIHLGVDGISLPLLVLTALLTFLCALHSYGSPPRSGGARPRAFVALILVLEAGTLATFAVLDLLLFFLAFEMVLIPMYFLIARWGGEARERAAGKFILYTLLGSIVMLLGLLLLGLEGGTFDMMALAADNGSSIGHTTQLLAVLAIGTGLAVKTPMWPLHSWLPDAHTAAPTAGSVLLAGVLLKMGTYGLVRLPLATVPDGFARLAPVLAVCGVVGIIWGGLVCLVERELKRLIAWSSIAHMGFVALALASGSDTGVTAALYANIAHGVISALLFLVVGGLKHHWGDDDLTIPRAALRDTSPLTGFLLLVGLAAGLGLPGLAGFWGEFSAVVAALSPAGGRPAALFVVCAVVAAVGAALAAAYSLRVARLVWLGEGSEGSAPPGREVLTRSELVPGALLALAVLALGVVPGLLLAVTEPALVGVVSR